jgi:hypothetical protein
MYDGPRWCPRHDVGGRSPASSGWVNPAIPASGPAWSGAARSSPVSMRLTPRSSPSARQPSLLATYSFSFEQARLNSR